jgi:PAS domain S-box-containing protein
LARRRGGRALRADSALLAELLDILAEAVTVRDRDGDIIYANRPALALLGFETLEQMQSRSSGSIMGDYMVEDEHGRPLTIDDVPSVRLVHDQPGEPLLMHVVSRETGEARWRLLKAAPLRDERGRAIAAVTVIEDVTAVKTAEVRMRVLAESGRVLASSLDYEQTLENVAHAAVPALADFCAVDLFDEHGSREHAITAHRDPARQRLVQRMRELESPEPDPAMAVNRVIRSGCAELLSDISDEYLTQIARNDEHLGLLRALEIRSALLVPMRVPTRTVGVMTLVTAESHRRLSDQDLELAEQLGSRAAVAVENARLHTTLASVAEILQRSLLPNALPEVPGWELASLYRPAGSDRSVDVGGDFYEFFETDAGWSCLVGDVTGRGVTAAALTAVMRHGARFAGRFEPDPAAILRRLDEELRQHSGSVLCSALCANLRGSGIAISSAGHPPALIVAPGGTVREAPAAGPLLGAFDDAQWPQEHVDIDAEDLVVLYTDGVVDTPGERERFGPERLQRLLAECAGESPREVLDRLDAALDGFRAGPRRDDVVALALRPDPILRPDHILRPEPTLRPDPTPRPEPTA